MLGRLFVQPTARALVIIENLICYFVMDTAVSCKAFMLDAK
jgi:hypothetical protein